jgi:CBS domain-containing protein
LFGRGFTGTSDPVKRWLTNILKMFTAAEVMTRGVFTLPGSLSIREAAWALMHRGVGAAPVHDDDGRLVGVFSNVDLLEAELVRGRDDEELEGRPVTEVMTPAVVAVGSDEPVDQVIDLMAQHGYRRVFVVDDDGRLIGVVATMDILRLIADGRLRLLDSDLAEPSFHEVTG